MSNPSELETIGGPPAAGEGTGWTLLRHGWPALLIFTALAWGYLVQPVGLDGEIEQTLHGLSREALAEGRWSVLVSHVFVSPGIMGGIVAGFVTFGAVLTTPMLRNPDWMGGWRLLAVFAISAAAAGAAHLLSGAPTPLLGPWPALAAVALWTAIAGRGPRIREPDEQPAHRRSDFEEAFNLVLPFLFLLIIGSNEIRETAALLLPGFKLPLWTAAVALAGVGVVGFFASRFGGEIGRRVVAGMLGLLWLGLVISLAARYAPQASAIVAAATGLPWASWAAALAVGVAAGLQERRGRSVPAH